MAMMKCVDGDLSEMTPEEEAGFLASLPAPPSVIRKASIKQILYAVNQLELRDTWDAWLATQSRNTKDYFIVESDTLENNPKIARGAAAIGVPVVDLVDLALTL